MTTNILRIDASARTEGSVSRDLTDRVIDRFRITGPVRMTIRDLATGLPQIDEGWVGANFTPATDRTPEQRQILALSDTLVQELQAADVVVIGLPLYNFGVPASLKAWVDQVARAGVTFQYSDQGPVGLLQGKRVVLAVASGGTEIGSSTDFATGYMRHILGFVGINAVDVIHADRLAIDSDAAINAAYEAISALPIAA